MTISTNRIVGALAYRTREALNANTAFMTTLAKYPFAPNCLYDGKLHLWHYPGTHSEISQSLLAIGENSNGSLVKFPAIFNFLPVRQVEATSKTSIYLNLAICATTNSQWLTEQREQNVFDTILRPIYEEFMRQVERCGWFLNVGYGVPSHTKYEVYTTGDTKGVLVEQYGEHIDAIELHNLELMVKTTLCERDIAAIESEDKKTNGNN